MPALPENFEKRLKALHRNGNTRNEIARKLGVSPSTVTNHCRRLGLSFDRNETAAAVQAHSIDLRVRRQAILARLYDRVEKNLDRLEADGYTYSLVLPGGAESSAEIVQQTDDDPPSGDERNHMSVVAGYLQAAAKLEAIDADGGATEATSLLSRLGDFLWGEGQQ